MLNLRQTRTDEVHTEAPKAKAVDTELEQNLFAAR